MNNKFTKRLSFSLVLAIGLFILITGCDKELNEIDENKVLKKLTIQEEALINSNNNLSLDVLKSEFQNDESANYFFSPVSAGMALGMIYNGVGEQEKLQIQQTLGLEALEEHDINKSYNELLSFLQASNTHMNISYANSLWFSTDIHINENYRTKVMAYYDAEIGELNFNKTSSLELINHWGNIKTRGHFEKIINNAPPKNTDIFLINAFGLNTSWNQVHNTFISKGSFSNLKGEVLKMQILNMDGIDININEKEDYSFIEFPFEDKAFFFSIVMPQDGKKAGELMNSFTIEDLKNLRENSSIIKANVSLPGIKFSNDKPLKSTLSRMGLQDIFSESADFSPSFVESNKYLAEINQKAEITMKTDMTPDLNDMTFSDSSLRRIVLNKPFWYFVRDKHTQTVLFAGYFVNPTK